MSEQTLHGGLTAERWNQFPLERRLMMIASEFARASQLVEGKGGRGDAQRCYARARELLSWTAAWLRTQPNESLAQRLEAIGREMDEVDFDRWEPRRLVEQARRMERAVAA